MQSAMSDRTGVFILALQPWVIAIASAGAVASDGSGAGDDVGDHLALRDSRPNLGKRSCCKFSEGLVSVRGIT
jgi:hypothetical protein